MKKHFLAALFLSTLFAATAWAQDSGETKVRTIDGFGPSTGVVKWTVKRYDGLHIVDIANAIFMPWDSAVAFCRQNFGGRSGWRLASRRDAELFVKLTPETTELFWIDERDTYYYHTPGRPDGTMVVTSPEKQSDQKMPLCVADGNTPKKTDGAKPVAGTSASAAGTSAAGKPAKDPIAQADDERLKLEREKPGSREARGAAAKYYGLLAKQKATPEDLARADYERLKAERDNPGSKEAWDAEARYTAMRGQKVELGSRSRVSKGELAAANYERLRLARYKPDSAEAKAAESSYQALLKASEAQAMPSTSGRAVGRPLAPLDEDSAEAMPRTPGRIVGPVLTRVEQKKPSADEVAAQKQREADDRKRKADEAAALKARQAEDAAKAKAREDIARASCMKPENRGMCSCLRFYPNESRGACGK